MGQGEEKTSRSFSGCGLGPGEGEGSLVSLWAWSGTMHNDITHKFSTPAMSWGSLQNLHFNKTLGWFLYSERQNSDTDGSENVSHTPALSSKNRLTFPGLL